MRGLKDKDNGNTHEDITFFFERSENKQKQKTASPVYNKIHKEVRSKYQTQNISIKDIECSKNQP